MREVTINFCGKTHRLLLDKSRYSLGGLAIEVTENGEPFTVLSVFFDGSANLPDNQCYFKNWSENEGILEQLEEHGLIKRLGPVKQCGFVQAPLVEVLF